MEPPATQPANEGIVAIPGMRELLRLMVELTGLRIALVARVTEESWTCYAVVDEAGFGLEVGSSLDVSTTY